MNTKAIIFPASRSINHEEKLDILMKIEDFLTSWKVYENPLQSNVCIEYEQFIIICIDENIEPASGCSLDALNNFIRKIEQKYQLELFDRMKAVFLENNTLKTLRLKDFCATLKNKELRSDILIFDFSSNNEEEFSKRFLLPLKESWAKDY
jgi:hypothetical protein